jgi:hypothetical protein
MLQGGSGDEGRHLREVSTLDQEPENQLHEIRRSFPGEFIYPTTLSIKVISGQQVSTILERDNEQSGPEGIDPKLVLRDGIPRRIRNKYIVHAIFSSEASKHLTIGVVEPTVV